MSRLIVHRGSIRGYQPETIDYLNVLSVPNDTTIYFSGLSQQITGIEIWNAIDQFFVTCKITFSLTLGVNNMSTIFDAIYPYLLGTSTSAKYNAVNPLDTNGAFRLSFSGGWTINEKGIKGNATNAYANTFWDSTANAGSKRFSHGGVKYNIGSTGLEGSWDLNNPTRIYNFASSDQYSIGTYSTPGNGNSGFTAIKVDSTNARTYNNTGLIQTDAGVSLTLCPIPMYIGARNNNNASIGNYNDICWAFRFITGKVEITNTQMLAFKTAVEQLQIDLNR